MANSTARAELKGLLISIDDRKAAIQFAADAEWPHTDEEQKEKVSVLKGVGSKRCRF